MTAKMSKSKKKKLKKRAKRNQQLMNETMQHIVEKEQEQVEGHQHVGTLKTTDGENSNTEITSSGDHQLKCATELSPDKINDSNFKDDDSSDVIKVLDSEVCDENKTPHMINGTSQNGGTVQSTTNCQTNLTLDELDDIDECDALDESCKVDGK